MTANVTPLKDATDLAERSDDDLMGLLAQGITPAFEVLVRRHARRVLGYCARQCGDPQRGEELAQEIWLAVWNQRESYEADGKFVPWLFTLLRNRVRNLHRDHARRPLTAVAGDPEHVLAETADAAPNDLERLLAVERRARVDRVVTVLPEQIREALRLRFTEDLSYADIANVLETNESTVRSRVFHGLRELRRRLKESS